MKIVARLAGLAAVLIAAWAAPLPHARAAPPVIQPSKAVPAEKVAPAGHPAAPAAPETPPDRGSVTGLPIPRFVSLRTNEVNMRVGPGMRYPIEWVYKWRGLPVKVLREFQVWRLVEAPDGTKGWMHQATIVGTRTFLVTGKTRSLRDAPRGTAGVVAELRVGVIGKLKECKAGSAWCRVQVGDRGGWLRRDEIWGVLPDEVVH